MFRLRDTLAAALLAAGVALPALAQDKFPGIGRAATPKEVAAWDIDVRPDFKGLPKGSGSVERGMEVFEQKCASCHGTFGESNEVFTPLIGGTTADDIKTGRVRGLSSGELPQRTTFTKVATISTLFDYIQRAMPWTAPKSLKPDEVYAVLAYMLNLAEIVPADFVLSDTTIVDVQKRMPNRNGMSTNHGMWPGASAAKGGMGNGGKPDMANTACMKNCGKEVKIGSTLPGYARTAHGNLAEQNRSYGAVRGTQTLAEGVTAKSAVAIAANPNIELATKSGCLACHAISGKVVGPAFKDVHKRYKDTTDGAARLIAKVKAGGEGVWGAIPMPAQDHVGNDDIQKLVKWILGGAE